jgi:hypothetical protein
MIPSVFIYELPVSLETPMLDIEDRSDNLLHAAMSATGMTC